MTITKSNIIDQIYTNTDLSKPESIQPTETTLEIINRMLVSSEDVLITGFGKFKVMTKDQRKGRNPASENDFVLDARRVVKFKCSEVLKERLNGK